MEEVLGFQKSEFNKTIACSVCKTEHTYKTNSFLVPILFFCYICDTHTTPEEYPCKCEEIKSMCKCNPSIRAPWCENPECKMPNKTKISFEQSGKKVLKKCKECGIYPSYFNDANHCPSAYGNIRYYCTYMCPKCHSYNMSSEDAAVALLQWNKANGLDENDKSTWHDGITLCSPCEHTIVYCQESEYAPRHSYCARCGSRGPFGATS